MFGKMFEWANMSRVLGILGLSNGGTGASSASGARTNLNVYSKEEVDSAIVSGTDSNDKGYFATESALNSAYPTGENGWFAIVGATDTVWIWDNDSSEWVDSGNEPVAQVQSDWNATEGLGEILNKPEIFIPVKATIGAGITGIIDGTNGVFVLDNIPRIGTETPSINGVDQFSGAGKDYQISDATITFESTRQPKTGDDFLVQYYL